MVSEGKVVRIILVAIVVLIVACCGRNFFDNYNCSKAKVYLSEGYALYIDGTETDPDHINLWNYRHDKISIDYTDKEIHISK